jgi:di/tricarboxylate transporter
MKIRDVAGISIRADVKLGDQDLQTDEIRIAEALITPQSELIGKTLKEANFRVEYGLSALAIYRHGRSLRDKIGRIRLRMGDLLLLQGPAERVNHFRRHDDFWILEEMDPSSYRRKRGLYTAAFFFVAVAVAALGVLPISVCFLGAALMTVASRSITIDEAYEFIHWKLLILIGGMTAFGVAMNKTGAAAFLAGWVVSTLGPFGVTAILLGLFVMTILLTQPLSNAAAALVVAPIAVETAQKLGANPRTFAIAIMLAASISFIAPFEPSCVLVYGPGKYRFRDFVKTGVLLTIIMVVLVLFVMPLFWPLYPD